MSSGDSSFHSGETPNGRQVRVYINLDAQQSEANDAQSHDKLSSVPSGGDSKDHTSPPPGSDPHLSGQSEEKKEEKESKEQPDKPRDNPVKVLKQNLQDTVAHARYTGVNPFITRTPPSACYESIKITLMSLTFIPIVRIILMLVAFFMIVLFAKLAVICKKDKKEPLSRCRRAFIYPIRFLVRLLLFFAGFYWVVKNDLRKDKSKMARILVANHISMWDVLYVFYDTGCCALGKKELFGIPLLGNLLYALQFLPVDRDSSSGRSQGLQDIKDRVANTNFPPLLIFPEGTTSNDLVLTAFKKGSFATGTAVQPVCLQYPNKHCDLYYGFHSMGYYIYWTCCQLINFHTVTYLDTYEPSEAEKADPGLFAKNVREVMRQYLGVATTEHSYADIHLLFQAYQSEDTVDFVVDDVQRLFHLKPHELEALIKKFKQAQDRDNQSGKLSFDEFCKVLQLDNKTQSAQHLFSLFDTDLDGSVDFVEFVAAVAILSSSIPEEEVQRLLFSVTDTDNDGQVSKQELTRTLNLARKLSSIDMEPEEIVAALFPSDLAKRRDSVDQRTFQQELIRSGSSLKLQVPHEE